MTELSRDPIVNAIHNGIKQGIRVTIDHRCFGSAVILIYSGIDTMAYLGMPGAQAEVQRTDFVKWVDGYIHFPCEEKISGLEFYAARCAMLHNYGVRSRLTRQGQCRQLGYLDKSVPEIRYVPEVPDSVLVSVPALAEAFFNGVDSFLIDLFAHGERASLAEQRLRTLVAALPGPGAGAHGDAA